jgi:hypothetical protein
VSVTLITAAYIETAAYSSDPADLPQWVSFIDSYDHSTVQARRYVDAKRGKIGCVVLGSNERADWARNFDFRPVRMGAYLVAAGWKKGAVPLAVWCEKNGVQEMIGHSKGAAEALLVGALNNLQVLALASPKPFFGTPPVMDALCVRNPRDFVGKLPPGSMWKTPGSTLLLPWDPPDLQEDHRVPRIVEALMASGLGYLALTDDPTDETAVVQREPVSTRGFETARRQVA